MAHPSLSFEAAGERNLLLDDDSRRRLAVLADIAGILSGTGQASILTKDPSRPGMPRKVVDDAVALTHYVLSNEHDALPESYSPPKPVFATFVFETDGADKADPTGEGGADDAKEDGSDEQ